LQSFNLDDDDDDDDEDDDDGDDDDEHEHEDDDDDNEYELADVISPPNQVAASDVPSGDVTNEDDETNVMMRMRMI